MALEQTMLLPKICMSSVQTPANDLNINEIQDVSQHLHQVLNFANTNDNSMMHRRKTWE